MILEHYILKEMLLSNIEKVDRGYKTPCLEWQGLRFEKGYGRFKNKGVHILSAMIFLNFDINSKLFVCHHCDNPPCINPDHLFIGTHQDNMDDRNIKGRTASGEKNGMYGKNHTKKSKRKMSLAQKGRTGDKNSFYGKHHSEETKKKISIARTGKGMGNTNTLGYKHTEETKRKISVANIGYKHTEGSIKKMCEAQKRRREIERTTLRIWIA